MRLLNYASDKATNKILYDLKITGETLRAARSKKDVLDFTIRIFLRLGFDRVRIWLIDQEKQIYYGAKCSYISDKKFQKACVSLDSKILPKNYMRLLKEKKPYCNKSTPLLKKYFGDYKLDYSIQLPLLSGKQLLGTISVDNAFSLKEIFLKDVETRIMPFVNHVALVLNRVIADEKIKIANLGLKQKIIEATSELKIKNEELEKLANYDDLSGLPNRRHLEQYLSQEFKKATQKNPITLAILDVDFLKQVNDTRGHEAGDQLIRKIGGILKKDSNIVFASRFAGDEFVFLTKDKTNRVRKKTFDSILKKIKRTIKQTVSIGAVTYPNPSIEIKNEIDLIRIADDALYHAKHTGRDRFVLVSEKSEETVIPLAERRMDLQKIEKRGTFAIDYIRQLRALNKISEHLRNNISEKIILEKIVKSFRDDLEFKRVGIYLEQEDGKMALLAHSNVNKVLVKKISQASLVPKLDFWIKKVMQDRQVANLDESEIPRMFTKIFGVRRILLIPLIGRTIVLGVIVAEYDPERIIHKNDLDFFLTLGDQIESGILKLRVLKKTYDFNKRLKNEINTATFKLRKYSHTLENQIKTIYELREKEQRSHFELISTLVTSLEEKDVYTRGHSVRVASYAVRLGQEIGMDENRLTNLHYAGLLHDIGKVTVDQSILHKKTALTENEIRELKKHPVIGEKIVSSAKFLEETAHIIRHHHEKWNGTGYPDCKKRENILLESRILAITDSYDAMVTRRSYGHKMRKIEAVHELEAGSGKQFDPKLVKVFIKLLQQGKIRTSKFKN